MSENISAGDFEIFKEALTEENLELQVDIIQKLESLAKALGEKATREELLPFIELHYIELHDEILLYLADQLRTFVSLLGGLEHSKTIFDILGKLCITDENLVRERAVQTLISIQSELDTEQTEEYLLPVVNELINDDWFTSKCSAVALFAPFYPKLSEGKKAEFRNTFKMLIQDDSPMVRKASATACVNFVAAVEESFLMTEFVPIFQDIAQDPMDTVRSVTIDIALALIKRLGSDGLDSIFKTIEAASDDSSWRLRQQLANNIANLQHQIPYGKYRGKLVALFQKLARDGEPEVRILAASNLCSYCKCLKESYTSQPVKDNNFEPVFEQSIMSIIRQLAMDESEDVRLALSSNILPLSGILSENCFKKNIVSFLLEVLGNEESIAVQTNFLLGLGNLSSNVDLTQSLGAIKNSVRAVIVRSQANWRTRRSILMTFVDIAKFCSANYFSDHFKIYYAALLGDSVFAVRRSASLILPILSKHYGIKWASEHLVLYFTMFTRDSRYLYRFVSLFGITEMINPHLCSNPDFYLRDFKKLTENKNNKKAILALAKIVKTSRLVQKELKEEKYSSILRLKEHMDYLSERDTDIYSEKDFNKLREKYKNINLYSVEEKDLEQGNWCYLQGILSLIYNKFLPIIDTLNRDKTENIQIRAVCTLSEISVFIAKLEQEESEQWVQDCFTLLSNEERETIKEEILREFQTAEIQEEELIEKIDTNLIYDRTEKPDLSETICIEQSGNSSKVANKTEGVEQDSLVQEVLDILDKNISEGNDDDDDDNDDNVVLPESPSIEMTNSLLK